MDVTHLNIAQLEELAVAVQEELKRKKALARKNLLADLERIAREAGLSLDELMGSAPSKPTRSKSTVAVKYRNPNNPDQAWTGRGRQPLWLAALLAEGHSLSELAV